MRARVMGGLLVAAALAAASPTGAGAASGSQQQLQLRTTGSNGYSIELSGEGQTAFLEVSKRSRSRPRAGASSVYITRAKLTGSSLKATFGDLGTASMRFRPSGRVKRTRPARGCRGPDHFTTRYGVFVGRLDFEGEGGYTATHLHRAKGRVTSPLALNCANLFPPTPQSRRYLAARKAPSPKRTALRASWRLGLKAVSFTAVAARRARFFAEVSESEGGLAVYRFAFALASPLAFAADDALSLAGVTPPAPFSGSGTLRRDAGGAKSWTGSLAVSFPGAPSVPLTGPQFKTQLTRSW
jgi:hypothetical protein